MNMRSVNNFFKYHNAVPLLLAVVVLGAGVTFATSPDLRQSVFSSGSPDAPKILPVKKTDVTKLSAIDLEQYDFALRIDAISEDTETYFVSYSYKTLEVMDSAWQETRKMERLTIPKQLLGKRSLKDYLSDQIGQVISRQVAYLSEVRTSDSHEAAKGKASKEYASLVGKGIDTQKTAPSGQERSTSASQGEAVSRDMDTSVNTNQANIPKDVYSKAEIEKMIVTAVADFLAVDMSMPDGLIPAGSESISVPATAVPDETHASPAETTEESVSDLEVGE